MFGIRIFNLDLIDLEVRIYILGIISGVFELRIKLAVFSGFEFSEKTPFVFFVDVPAGGKFCKVMSLIF